MANLEVPVAFHLSTEDAEVLANAAQRRHMSLNNYLGEFATVLAKKLRTQPDVTPDDDYL